MTLQDREVMISKITARCKSVSRPGLYFMVVIIFLNSCHDSQLTRVEQSLDRIEAAIGTTKTVFTVTIDTNSAQATYPIELR